MTQTATTEQRPATPFDRIGGRDTIARMVDRFYDLMDEDPAYAELRALHAPDLTPMRDSLTDFLMAWMGGPRDWFDQRPGACVMSAHRKITGITPASGEQWIDAISRAARETVTNDAEFVEAMIDALSGMARAMVPRPPSDMSVG